MFTNREEKIYNYLLDNGYFAQFELDMVISIYPDTPEEAMNALIFYSTGYHCIEDLEW